MAAEAVVSFVIERLGDLITQKIAFLRGVRGQVKNIRDELVRMRCFLKDADQKQHEEASIKNWVSEIRCAAYDAEDVIEIFIHKVESFEKKGFLSRLSYKPTQWIYLYKVGKEIESVQSKIKDIAESRKNYAIGDLGDGSSTQREMLQELRLSFPFGEEEDVVGLKDKTKYLVAQLLKEDRRRCVVSVVGMGGVGKTTLAKKVYNHANVRARFDCRAWVCVSQSYNFENLLKTILMQVSTLDNVLAEVKNMDKQQLVRTLHAELENKCYLLVLDDIWEEKAWDFLSKAFPDAGNACRLLLTSRNQEVPVHADALSVPYVLKPLGPEDSWQLLVKKAIEGGVVNATPDLEVIGREIIERCEGLPLAITVIGGILLKKKNIKSEWERVLRNLSSNLSRNQNGVSAILELSYADLSPHLKLCFLSLGLFPEDYEISVRRLIHMWIAEGMIQNRDAVCLEEIAEDYLNQLINRNMVQIVMMSFNLKVKSCRIHDLLRELANEKAEDENIFQIHKGLRDFPTSMKSRYVAVHCCSESSNFSIGSRLHIRSLLFIETGSAMSEINHSFMSFRLLRVLDLEDMDIKYLPKEIGKLILLRYLNLRSTTIKELPNSLTQLYNLQTLDISFCHRLKVSNIICKLRSLEHLYMRRESCDVPLRVKELGNLRTFSRIDLDYLMHDDLLSLTNLRELGIQVHLDSEINELCSSLAQIRNFRSLKMHIAYVEFPSLAGLSVLTNLTELKLSGKLIMLPPFPPSLSSLTLRNTSLKEDPMPTLGELRQLSFLRLKDAYRGQQISIPANGFPQLKSLELNNMRCLEEIKVEKGAMPELRWLRIIYCSELKMLPEELKYMSALEKLELVNMEDDFVTRVEGEDSYKVCNVPSVTCFHYQKREVNRLLKPISRTEQLIGMHISIQRAGYRFARGMDPEEEAEWERGQRRN